MNSVCNRLSEEVSKFILSSAVVSPTAYRGCFGIGWSCISMTASDKQSDLGGLSRITEDDPCDKVHRWTA